MRSFIILLSLLIILTPLVSASYAGDKPLMTINHDTHKGGVDFTLGNSTYSGEMEYNDTYTVEFDIDIPDNGTIRMARAYTYWVWSKKGLEGIYPQMDASVIHNQTASQVSRSEQYSDTKGFVSRYDFFSGIDAYDLNDIIFNEGTYSISLRNSADDGRTVCLQGIGLLIIYESDESPVIEYWVNEGCDMLFAEHGITPEMATTTIYFNGDVDTEYINKASLITVSPSGGFTQGAKQSRNKLYFNEKTQNIPVFGDIIKILFGSGKVWKNVYIISDSVQIAVDEREVTNYLQSVDNFVSVQDSGDYLLITNAIFTLELGDEQRSENASGFGLLFGIILIMLAYMAIVKKR